MKVIIAGSRNCTQKEIYNAIHDSKLSQVITEVISGNASTGGDYWGEQWAIEHNIPVRLFPAKWNDLTLKPCIIKINRFGKEYNVLAGFNRNEEMAKYAAEHNGALIAVCRNHSNGTTDMIERANNHKLTVFPYYI
jgi:hypothetical protein